MPNITTNHAITYTKLFNFCSYADIIHVCLLAYLSVLVMQVKTLLQDVHLCKVETLFNLSCTKAAQKMFPVLTGAL